MAMETMTLAVGPIERAQRAEIKANRKRISAAALNYQMRMKQSDAEFLLQRRLIDHEAVVSKHAAPETPPRSEYWFWPAQDTPSEVREPARPSVRDIQKAVVAHYPVGRTDLISARRTADVVRPRQVAMYLAKKLTLRSLPEIGRAFGGRDHTTVLHAVRKIGALMETDPALKEVVETIRQGLEGDNG